MKRNGLQLKIGHTQTSHRLLPEKLGVSDIDDNDWTPEEYLWEKAYTLDRGSLMEGEPHNQRYFSQRQQSRYLVHWWISHKRAIR